MSIKNKIQKADEAVSVIGDGASIMIGGFLCCGMAEILIDALVKKGSKNLTLIVNDASFPGRGVDKLLSAGQVKRLIAGHVGTNPNVVKRVNAPQKSDRLECILVPLGTLAERIRAGGFGLGGFLTTVGIGTLAAKGKKTVSVDGKKYLLELPLKADFAFIYASVADKFGNGAYRGSTRNLNPLMASAAKHSILAAKEIVEIGQIDPNNIVTPGIFIKSIVEG